jgi:hypothetical protein
MTNNDEIMNLPAEQAPLAVTAARPSRFGQLVASVLLATCLLPAMIAAAHPVLSAAGPRYL